MNVTVSTRELKRALQRVKPIVPRRTLPTLTILRHVLVEVIEGNLFLTATDLDDRITLNVPASGKADGSACVDYRSLDQIARKAGSEVIRIDASGATIAIRAGAATFQLEGMHADEYPAPAKLKDPGESWPVESDELKRCYARVRHALATEETRPILQGVCVESTDDGVFMVATNGHKLVQARLPALVPAGAIAEQLANVYDQRAAERPGAAAVGFRRAMIVRRPALDAVTGSAGAGETVTVRQGSGFAEFRTELATVTTRLIDGPYPNYRQVIPQDCDRSFTVDRRHILAAVERVSLFSSGYTQRMVISAGAGVILRAEQPDTKNTAQEAIEAEFTGDPITIGFNARYLIDTLRALNDERVRISLKAPERAAVVTSADEENDGSVALVMPLRLLD